MRAVLDGSIRHPYLRHGDARGSSTCPSRLGGVGRLFFGPQDPVQDRKANVPSPPPIAAQAPPGTLSPWPVAATSASMAGSEHQDLRSSVIKVQSGAESQKPNSAERLSKQDAKHKVAMVMTAAAIAAILIQASRNQYHATGRPCACPDDLMRNGRACGGRSAYSRPGGSVPLCYPTDVTPAMVEAYRKTTASR
ncbi:hypothetical protein ABH995_000948 [Bradyrhizobium yuanmingense]